MIQTAKKLEAENLTFICLDINDIEYKDSFDIIFLNAALHWVNNHQQLLQNSFTALKKWNANMGLRWKP